jgi:hypothetical protein
MLTLTLTIPPNSNQVQVSADGAASHTFPLAALAFGEQQAAEFFETPERYGRRLYDALLAGPAGAALQRLARPGRLILRLEDPALNGIPWEYLHDGRHFVATEYALARQVPGVSLPPQEAALLAARRPRLLFVPADPLLHHGQPAPYALGVEGEWDALRGDLTRLNPPLDLTLVLPPTMDALQQAAAGMRGGIVHFTGHGSADGRQTSLVFEQANGADDLIPAADFAARLRGRAALVLLSACLSATPGHSDEANLAALLSAQGTPYVLGMQLRVADRTARRFTDSFYHHLFCGEDVFEAVRQARLRVLGSTPGSASALEMGLPVLYAADPALPGVLLPAAPEGGLHLSQPPAPTLDGLPPVESGFFGRQRELVRVGSLLTAERLRQGPGYPPLAVTLHGPGGIGKTALLLRAAARFAWAFADGVLAVPLEPLPPPQRVLERLEAFCGLPDGGALELEARLERAARHLQEKRLLLALDNFESLLYARDGQDAERKSWAATALSLFARPFGARAGAAGFEPRAERAAR